MTTLHLTLPILSADNAATALNTPLEAVSAPVSQSGFFTPIEFGRPSILLATVDQWPGSAQPYNSLRAKSASGLRAVLKYLAASQQGVNSTNLEGAVMAATIRSNIPLSFRLAAYRGLRRIVGPVLAHRVAFGLGGAV